MENRLDGGSLDMEQVERERLKSVFPQCFVEGKLDIDKLLNLCGEYIDNDFEKYKFEWHGKGEALKLAQRRSMGALRPCVEESVDWDTTENLYIEGDNLEVLKLLQTAYYRRVKMIYIDPPYNTGNDFVYEDDFADPINRYKEVTAQTTKSNPETMGRFHTNWLNMIYPRLRLAANLLTDDGVIFISIDDNEIHNLRKVCDEVFGEENFVGIILWKKKTNGNNMGLIPPVHDYIVVYAKNIECILDMGYEITEEFIQKTYSNPDNDSRGPWTTMDLSANHKGPYFSITNPANGQEFLPPDGRYWVFNEEEVKRRIEDGRIIFGKTGNTRPVQKVYAQERNKGKIRAESWWDKHGMNSDATSEMKDLLNHPKLFTHPKPSILLHHLVKIASGKDTNDIILDFFSGSGTTAHAVMQLNAEDGGNRKFICVQLPEVTDESSEAYKAGYKNICEIGKERIRRAGTKIASSSCHCGLDPQSAAATTLFDEIAGQARNDNESQACNDNERQACNDNESQACNDNERQARNDNESQACNDNESQACNDNESQACNDNESQACNDNEDPTSNGTNKEGKKLDTGFKVFKLDTSNLKTWDASTIDSSDPAQIDLFMERLNGMIETIKPDRTDTDMVYEVMLKMGIPLTYSVTPVEIGGKTAYSVGADCLLLVCLQEGLSTEIIETMASDYLPSKLVLSEKCFADDTAMANAHYILKEREIELKLV